MSSNQVHHEYLREGRSQLSLAIPLILVQLADYLLGAVDAIMLGQYTQHALAGSALANGVFFLFTMASAAIIMGLDSLIPVCVGAKRREEARVWMWQGIYLAIPLSLVMMAIVATIAAHFSSLGVDEPVASLACEYTMVRLPSMFTVLVYTATRSLLQAHERGRILVIALLLTNVINVLANGLLIFGDAALLHIGLPAIGAPELGIQGAGISTTLSSLTGALFCAYAVRSEHAPGLPLPNVSRRAIRRVLRLGVPLGIAVAVEVLVFSWVSVLAGRVGSMSASVHQVAITLTGLGFNIQLGMGAAVCVRVGLGGGDDIRRIRGQSVVGLSLVCALMFALAALVLGAGDQIVRLFGDQVLQQASLPIITVVAVFLLFDGIQGVSLGILRGMADTRSAFIANVLGHCLVGLPLTWVFGITMGYGVVGMWWGLAVGLAVVAVVAFIRLAMQLTPRERDSSHSRAPLATRAT